MYIDHLIEENNNIVNSSQWLVERRPQIQRTGRELFENEPYVEAALRSSVPFPSPKFRSWIRRFGMDIEVAEAETPAAAAGRPQTAEGPAESSGESVETPATAEVGEEPGSLSPVPRFSPASFLLSPNASSSSSSTLLGACSPLLVDSPKSLQRKVTSSTTLPLLIDEDSSPKSPARKRKITTLLGHSLTDENNQTTASVKSPARKPAGPLAADNNQEPPTKVPRFV
jgi:hypothetical protein